MGKNGFAATTVDALMQATGVSRGSVLHQFATRNDLMVAAADFAMASMVTDTITRVEQIEDPAQRLSRLAEVMWEVHCSQSAIALTEVLLASRWDRGLAQRLMPIAERVESEIDNIFHTIAQQAGLQADCGIAAWGRLMIAAMRGLRIELMLHSDRKMIVAALDSLYQQHARLVAGWLETHPSA